MAKEQVWAMEPNYLHNYLERLELAATQPMPKSWFDDDEDDEPESKLYSIDDAGVATIPINGPLSMSGPSWWARIFGFGGTGYTDILTALEKINSDPSAKAIMLAVNSPGGEVNGCDQVWQAIRASQKPVMALNCGLMASAAYYLSSAAKSIYATGPGDETGSIGVVVSGWDDSAYMEKNGVRRINIYSKNAPNKAMSFSTEKGRELLQARVDAFERIFHARVAEGRGIAAADVGERFGSGGIFVAEDPDKTQPNAVKMGLIDGIGNAHAALLRMVESGPSSMRATLVVPIGFKTVENPEKPEKSPESKKPQEGKRMDLKEFMAQGPLAVAEIEAIKAEARKAGIKEFQEMSASVSAILEKDAYKSVTALHTHGLAVMKGEVSFESFKMLVATYDMMKADASLKLEQSSKLPETPAALQAKGAELVADAEKYKINIQQIQAAAKAQGIDPDKAVLAAIDNAKLIAADRGELVGA